MGVKRILVTGAGGFIGNHLVSHLKRSGYWVRGVDLRLPQFSRTEADEFELLDLREKEHCMQATAGVDEVYALAAEMGGMGYLSTHHAQVMRCNLLIDLHSIDAAPLQGVGRYFYASSDCVYPEYLQTETAAVALREEDAYPGQPQDGYGWEKLVAERLCLDYHREHSMEVRIDRSHIVHGPLGAWDGGREKAPAALCRKVALAKLSGARSLEIWGDGEQTRSFCYIDDCIEGIHKLMRSDWSEPLNLGQDRLVTINQLVDMITVIAGVSLKKEHVPGPQGVRGRNSNNTRVREVLDWSPEDGLSHTYNWIEEQVRLPQEV